MFKKLVLIVATILGGSCFSCSSLPPVHNQAVSDLIQEELDSTVALVKHPKVEDDEGNVTEDTSKWRTYCSGVWISDKLILTAAHCVKDEELINIGYKKDLRTKVGQSAFIQEAHEASVIKVDVDDDLALLQVDKVSHPHHYAAISSERILVGDQLTIVGHPVGLLYSAIPGQVVAERWMEGVHAMSFWLEINSNAFFGNSGGPAFNAHGEVVGIASFIMRAPGKTFFVHRDVILNFLDKK